MEFKSVLIKDIMNSPPTNSGLTRKNVYLGEDTQDLIPVYSASQDEDAIFGWVEKGSKWKTYQNVLTWNKDGSAGNVFYRKNKFVPYEKVKMLEIKSEFEDFLDYKFLKYVIENKLMSFGFDFGFKCSMERVLKVSIEVPINEDGNFDLNEQIKLGEKYEKIEKFKDGIKNLYQQIIELKLSLKEDYNKKVVKIPDIFRIKKGSAKYTRGYMRDYVGDYPVYSSKTFEEGIIGYIDSYDYDTECLTWTTDGIHAGTVFHRDGKFSMSTHCGALIPKESLMEEIDLEYVFFQLKINLKDYATGEGNKRITVEAIGDVEISIPVKDGKYDLQKQKELTKIYSTVDKIKVGLEKDFKELMETKLKLTV
jgi:hypothetical protein